MTPNGYNQQNPKCEKVYKASDSVSSTMAAGRGLYVSTKCWDFFFLIEVQLTYKLCKCKVYTIRSDQSLSRV